MEVTTQPRLKLEFFDLLSSPVEGVHSDFLDMQKSFMGSSSCEEPTAWMCELWDREDASPSGASASSLMDGTAFELDCSSDNASEDFSVSYAARSISPSDTAASLDEADPSSCLTEAFTWEARRPMSLQLDHSSVLSAWKRLGGAVQEPSVATSAAAVFLKLPAPGAGDAAILAAFGSYGGSHGSCSSGFSIGSVSAPVSPASPSSQCGLPNFVPVGVARHSASIIAAQDVSGSAPGPVLQSQAPFISACGRGLDLSVVGAGVVELGDAATKSSDARSARAACALRCKQKKSCRQVVKVRYEMRRFNAEQRPRFKGRFVKQDSNSQESLAQTSDSQASEFSDVQWLV